MIWKILIALGLAAALVAGCQHRDAGLIQQGRNEQLRVDQAAADQLKAEAAAKLAAETARVHDAENRLAELTHELEVAREKAQFANRAAVAARAAGERLRFVAESPPADRCGGGGGGTETEPDSAAGDPGAAVVELPAAVNRRLWELAGAAESLAIDYRVLYEWANNPGMVCTLSDRH